MNKTTYIIAEVGINHEGDVGLCSEMIRLAHAAGADAVKLQTIDADANYVRNSQSYATFKGCELSRAETEKVFRDAREMGLDVFTTCGDFDTALWVNELDPSAWKISSGLLTHTPLIKKLAEFGRPMFISNGMALISEVEEAINTIKSVGNFDISLFQCTSLYPAPSELLNLKAIGALRERFMCRVGFSDHSIGDAAAILSVAAGAELIEKHFSLDSSRPGYDHQISLEPENFASMVSGIRRAEKMMGSSEFETPNEIMEVRYKFLRTVVAETSIEPGDYFSPDNLSIKRPADGLRGSDPREIFDLYGLQSSKAFRRDDPVSKEDVLE